jgi:hypothetical protein
MTGEQREAEEELWVRRAGRHENTYGLPVGDERYRLTATALSAPGRVRYGAVVETALEADGRRWILSIAARSPYRSAMRVLSGAIIRSPNLEDLKRRITALGGMWEQVLGGILIVHVPRDSSVDPRAVIDGLVAAVRSERGTSNERALHPGG